MKYLFCTLHRTIWLNPAWVIFFIGIGSLTVNIIFYGEPGTSHRLFFIGILLCVLTYLLCQIATSNAPLKIQKKAVIFKTIKPIRFIKIYEALGVFGLIISLYLIYSRGIQGASEIYVNLRYARTVDQLPDYGAGHLSLFSLAASVGNLICNNKRRSIIFLVISFFPSFAAMERTGILYRVIFYAYFYFSIYGIKARTTVLSTTIVLGAFYLMSELLNKSTYNDLPFFVPYFSYGLTAFNEQINAGSAVTARDVFGIAAAPLDALLKPVYESDSSGFFNVYTYIFQPYVLMGELGLYAVMIGLGAIFYALQKYADKIFYLNFITASLLFSAVMIFYDWTFSLTTHLYMAIIAIPLTIKIKFK